MKENKPDVAQKAKPAQLKKAISKKPAVEKKQEVQEDVVMEDQETMQNQAPNMPEDEKPLPGNSNGYTLPDEIPIKGGGNQGYNLDQLEDERPVGGGNKGYTMPDEIPVSGGGNKGYNLDNLDEMPLPGSKKGYTMPEEMPISGNSKGYNIDEEMKNESASAGGDALIIMDSAPKKKKAPPARFAQKAKKDQEEEKEGIHQDEKQIEDVVMAPPKEEVKTKPPPRLANKAKTEDKPPAKATAKITGGKTAGVNIQDEDLGSGLSKEEAEAKVKETFDASLVGKLEEAKWQEKVEGFKGIAQQIVELQPAPDVIEALAKFIKSKMKDWKESNVNIIKENIALFTIVSQNCDKINRRAVACLMPFLSDKIGDAKVQQSVHELLIALAEIVTPKFIALQVIKYASSAKSPNVLRESCNILTNMTDEFTVVAMPLREMVDYAKIAANHSNAQVRTASMALFAMLYKHAGEAVRNFLKDIKESTSKLIEEEFTKITPLKQGEIKSKRGLRGEAAQEEGSKGTDVAAMLDSAVPREDISKQINSKLLPMFKHTEWKTRKQAADKVEEMLKNANMRILPVGLNELMDNMKQRMGDPNKAVLKSYIQLIGSLGEALGAAAKQYQKKVLTPMLQNLSDKQTLVRQDIVASVDKWSEAIGPEAIINALGAIIVQDNPELRTEALSWIIKHKDSIKSAENKELIKPLVSCLSDRTPAIRSMAEQVISEVMPLTGYAPFQSSLSDLKPAVQNTIKPILEKVKQKVGAPTTAAPNADSNNASLGNKGSQQALNSSIGINKPKEEANSSSLKNQAPTPKLKAPLSGGLTSTNKDEPKQAIKGSFADAAVKRSAMKTPGARQMQQRSESREAPLRKKANLAPPVSHFQEQSEQETLTVNIGSKDRRGEHDRKSKWQVEEAKGDQIERLKIQTNQVLGSAVQQKMFSNDFKQHLECIESFNYLQMNQPEGLLEILDIIFKWAQVKLADSSNTKFAINIFDFFGTLFQFLEDQQYMLLDFEAAVLFPLLCDKTGLNNSILKDKVKRLLRMTYSFYDKHKIYSMIITFGLNSKNMRAAGECMDELGEFIRNFGLDYTSEKDLKLIAKMADSNDKAIRENALVVMSEAYKQLGDDIWRLIGDVTPKVQGLFEQRFKKVKAPNTLGSFHNQEAQEIEKPPQNTTKSTFGLKRQMSSINDLSKKAVTPRGSNNLTFNKPQSQINQASSSVLNKSLNQPLKKSVNQFNSSLKSQEEQKKTPQRPTQKQGLLQRVSSNEKTHLPVTSSLQKKLIPQTQRQDPANADFYSGNREQHPGNQNLKSSFAGEGSVQKNSQLFISNDDDDDEDLRMLTLDDNFGGDPEITKQQDEITKHIHQLKYGDLSKRVDSLVALNEMISSIEQYKLALLRQANELTNAFTHVLMDIFDKPIEDIPLRFAKYFITIVNKACQCKEIMKEVSEERIFELAEQLLTRLLLENLDKIGENKEGELILKNLNSSMLRMLENCNHTYVFCVLFNLLRKYKDFHKMPKLPGLIIKCLLKLSKILEKLIDKVDVEKILLAIHEYLVVINHDNKTQNDEMGIRIVKTVINELVKLQREKIWESYRVIQLHNQQDHHIHKWIQIILKSLQSQGSSSSNQHLAVTPQGDSQIKTILEELRNSDHFESAIPKLYNLLEQNPSIDLNDYLQDCSRTFQNFIKQNLEKYRSQTKGGQVSQTEMMDSIKSTTSSNTAGPVQPQENQNQRPSTAVPQSNRITDYQSKLSGLRQRIGAKSGADTGTNKDKQSQQQMNSSFSAMNNSLSQKWHQLSQKSAATKREGQNLSNTLGGFGPTQALESKIGKGNTGSMNQSIGTGSGSQGESPQTGATNQDLNRRLAEMKAKLAAIKKK